MSRRSTKIISFFSGLLFVGITVGVTIAVNKDLQIAIKRQTREFIESGKSLVQQFQFASNRIQRISQSFDELQKERKLDPQSLHLLAAQNLNAQWAEIETANQNHH